MSRILSFLHLAWAWLQANWRDLLQHWRVNAASALRAELPPSRDQQFMPTLAVQTALASVVFCAGIWLSRHQLLGYLDGRSLLTLMRNQAALIGLTRISSNPLQGLGDVWYSTNTLWIPELRFGALFSDPQWQRVATTWFASVEVFVATALLAHWIGHQRTMAVASGWLAAILIMPITYPALLYGVSNDAPSIATLFTAPFIVVVLWEQIGRGPLWSDAARALAIAALLWMHFIALSIPTVVCYPLIVIVCACFLISAYGRAEFWRKIAAGAIIIMLLFESGLPQIMYGLIADTAFQLFPKDLPTRLNPQLVEGSILFRSEKFAW